MDTVARSSAAEPAFHDDVEEVVAYRTLSAMAIVGLLFGLASPLCFASPLFLLIPLIGAVISLWALRRIAASDGVLAGRAAAATGLALCVACGVAVVSRDALTRHLRTGQAEEFGRSWLALVLAGQTQQAFRLTIDGARPAPPPPEPGAPAPPPDPAGEFVKDPLVQAIGAAGADAKIVATRTLAYAPQSVHQFLVTQQFRIAPGKAATSANPSLRPVEAVLTLQRSHFPGQHQARWLVKSYELPSAAADGSTG